MKIKLALILALAATQAWAEQPKPTVIHTDTGSILIVPNYSTGLPMSIISTSSTREKTNINTTNNSPLVKNTQKTSGR